MSKTRESAAADIFFALGDRTRLSVVAKLTSGARSATALSEGAKVTRQAIVKHLQVLHGAGLLTQEKRGREVLYALDTRRLEAAKAFIEAISQTWDARLNKLKAQVEDSSP